MQLVFDSTSEITKAAVSRFRSKLESGELSRVLLTGGTLGIQFLADLSKEELDVSKVEFLFGDERFVSLDHPDRNEAQGLAAWPELGASLRRFPDDSTDLSSALDVMNSRLENQLGSLSAVDPVFDLVILGMGPDGHIASLFPGHSHGKTWVVSEQDSPKPPKQRLSFSYEALNRAREVWFLVSGKSKAEAVSCAMGEDCDLPVAKVQGMEQTIWFMDQELRREL